jgi:hypothetical protein
VSWLGQGGSAGIGSNCLASIRGAENFSANGNQRRATQLHQIPKFTYCATDMMNLYESQARVCAELKLSLPFDVLSSEMSTRVVTVHLT